MTKDLKERMREQRREAYQRAKERLKNDPRYIEMKARQKTFRKLAYQKKKAMMAERKLKPIKKNGEPEDPSNDWRNLVVRASDLPSEEHN